MNRRPLGLKLDKALTGFLQHKAAEALSPNTLIAYEHDLKLWIRYAGDVDVCQVTTQNLRAFLAWLHTDYKPHRFSGSEHPLAAKTVHNVWITLSSFFTWATVEFEMPNPMKAIPAPHFEKPPVEPFSKDDECPKTIKRSDWEGNIDVDGEELVVALHAGTQVES